MATKIIMGSDHAGFALKCSVIEHLRNSGYDVTDAGAYSEEPSDYPEIAKSVCLKVIEEKARGILVCGTGIGMSIAANRMKGIRAAHCTNTYDAAMSREHNDSNVLCLGGRTLSDGAAKELVDVWLGSVFTGDERHLRRLAKIES